MPESEDAAAQIRRHEQSIGRGLPAEQVDEIIKFARDASRRDWYARHEEVPFWYERYDKPGLTEKLSIVADAWAQVCKSASGKLYMSTDGGIQNPENVCRAAAHVARPSKPAGKELVLAFGLYKFKKYITKQWELVQHPARGFGADQGSQTMICIALEGLGPTNGFPCELEGGQDICIDSGDALWLPPTGGGMAMLIWIRL